ncbi:MAG: ABC transporter substrate-binding protein [Bellilinea sp.]|nr:MAG: ABC transporter substrate-binding protein [Bellilinea sp.]
MVSRGTMNTHPILRIIQLILVVGLIGSLNPALVWADSGLREPIEVRANMFGFPTGTHPLSTAYPKPSVALQPGDQISFTVDLPQTGEYTLAIDAVVPEEVMFLPPEALIQIDGQAEHWRLIFPLFYQDTADTFPVDRYGNETLIPQARLTRWSQVFLRDVSFSQPYPTVISLPAGQQRFRLSIHEAPVVIGSIYLIPATRYPGYVEYQRERQAAATTGVLIELEAEKPSYKNDTAIRPISRQNLEVTPYDPYRSRLNVIGGESWDQSGTTVYYEFTIPQDGWYNITLRAIQDYKNNFTVYRRILIDDRVLFAELNAVPFNYDPVWRNYTLGGETPYQIYLTRGSHVLGIEATTAPYHDSIQRVRVGLRAIADIAFEIKRLTGNQIDIYKEWEIADYIPDIRERLLTLADQLRADQQTLLAVNQTPASPEVLAYQMAIDNLMILAQDPNRIPVRMSRLSEGAGSAAQLLGSILPSLQSQPLAIDKIYIHSPDIIPPEPSISAGAITLDWIQRFIASFRSDPYQSIGAAPDELEVWVNRPQQYVNLLQQLTDKYFTPQTGIKVKFSIMPNESKLVLACAAGTQPDIALGVSTNIPYELAIRNALYDLRQFPDFDRFIRIYAPGSLLSYIIDQSVYAIPETQDFWVTYYRKDVLERLGLPVPQTWDEVLEILPELQRYGMNYNTALSSGSGLKGYLVTAPYLLNHGASLYTQEGLSGLGTDEAIRAIRFMAESFTIYGMPLTTSSFYESFRSGELPIGISNFETYLKLLTAAPEIDGLWDIALYPATVLPDGRQLRYATGSAQAAMMFANTDKATEGWTFLKWWMSTETQVMFQQELIMNYGLEYLWNPANLEAFRFTPIPSAHRDIILQQWQWLQEPVKLPGSYMQERELSNVWNRIVFDGANPRAAIDNAVTVINREIVRKMTEFGYIRNGERVRTFTIPTIDLVKEWMDNAQ